MEKINPESYSLLLKRAFEIPNDGMVVRLEVAEEAVRIAERNAHEDKDEESDNNKLFTDGTNWILCKGKHFADWATENRSSIPEELWHTGFFARAHKATIEEFVATQEIEMIKH